MTDQEIVERLKWAKLDEEWAEGQRWARVRERAWAWFVPVVALLVVGAAIVTLETLLLVLPADVPSIGVVAFALAIATISTSPKAPVESPNV